MTLRAGDFATDLAQQARARGAWYFQTLPVTTA
jgi:hypothetical protein